MRISKALALIGLISGFALAASPPLASATTTGTIHIYVYPNLAQNGPDKILVTGAIGDYGTSIAIDKNGKTDIVNGNFERITLKKGSFIGDATALNKITNSPSAGHQNLQTCSFEGGGTGPVTLAGGTGAYKNIKGTLTVTVTFAGYGPIKNGKCDTSQSAQPTDIFGVITGSGSISY